MKSEERTYGILRGRTLFSEIELPLGGRGKGGGGMRPPKR